MADAIICLGDVFTDKKHIEIMMLRAEKAVELCKESKAKKIIFTGGFKTRKNLSEAKFMADIALKFGIPPQDIILEERANTTVGNAYYSKEIMEKENFKSAIVVTSPHHLKRAKYIFERMMKDKELHFEKCKNNLNLFEAIPFYLDELLSLLILKIKGIDFSHI